MGVSKRKNSPSATPATKRVRATKREEKKEREINFTSTGQEIAQYLLTTKLSEKELKIFCRDKIAYFKQPKKFIIINELDTITEIPKGPTKKILYRKLKEYYKNFC